MHFAFAGHIFLEMPSSTINLAGHPNLQVSKKNMVHCYIAALWITTPEIPASITLIYLADLFSPLIGSPDH